MARYLNKPCKQKIVDCQVLDDVFKTEEVVDKDDGCFWFETDYFALKGNPDYLKLMKCLVVLQTQRTKILRDIDGLEELRSRAAVDPEGVKDLILNGDASYLSRINLEKVPEIDWSKYKTYNQGDRALRRNKPDRTVTRKESNEQIKVRGRPFHEKKPETFNQLWTVEEQLRLEALLEEFPPEPIENRRWKKIAAALGNRTTKQVCSRVQKYFQKLQKAGIAAPGIAKSLSKKAGHVHKRHKHLLYKPTTFFPGVAMGELSSESDEGEGTSVFSGEQDDFAHWTAILKRIEEYKRNFSIEEDAGDSVDALVHHGFKCSACGEEPIRGLRWECHTCPSYSACSGCMEGMPKKSPPSHPLTHHFQLIEEALNSDLTFFNKKVNYLDPSFVQ